MPGLSKKVVVTAQAYEFDSLPGYRFILGRGTASTRRVACMRAVESVFLHQALRRRHVKSFKCAFAVVTDGR